MKQTIGMIIVGLLVLATSFVSLALATLVVLSIINDGPNFWNVFWALFFVSGLFSTSMIGKK